MERNDEKAKNNHTQKYRKRFVHFLNTPIEDDGIFSLKWDDF